MTLPRCTHVCVCVCVRAPPLCSYDLVDLTRQMLSNLFVDLHSQFRVTYQSFQFNGTNTYAQVGSNAPHACTAH